MFKYFWRGNKHVIEFVGILSAVGALFLSIPIPDNEKARIALLNIQLVWLLIITLAVGILFFYFMAFFSRVESQVKKKFDLNIESTLSLFILFLSFWLLKNLWFYTLALYKVSIVELVHAMQYVGGAFGILLGAISFKIQKSIKLKYSESLSKFWGYTLSLAGYLLGAVGIAFWLEVQNLRFDIKKWLFSVIFVLSCFASLDLAGFVSRNIYTSKTHKGIRWLIFIISILAIWFIGWEIYMLVNGKDFIISRIVTFFSMIKKSMK